MLARALLLGLLLGAAQSAAALTIYKYVNANGVVTYSDRAVAGAKVFTFRDNMVERFEKQVRLETQRQGGQDLLVVCNDLYAPIDIELRLNGLNNVTGASASPIRQIIPARSQVRVATLSPSVPGLAMRYTPVLRHGLGDPRLAPSDHRYALPWQGGPFRQTQGANGRYSHFTPKGRYAVDIAMPEGTPIVAARAGTVIKIENEQTGRGANPSGNFVRILHEDGTMSVYLHLMQGSISVREGQRVQTGQALARSGNTGNSTGPHLHFVVQRNLGLAVESIPFDFAQPVGSLPNFAQGGD